MDLRQMLANAAASPPSAPATPSVGYPTNGNPGTGTPPGQPGAYWFHQIAEELRAVVIAGGLTPDHTTLTQVRDALYALLDAGPTRYINGLEIANGTDANNDIDIAAGVCRAATSRVALTLGATLTKQLDAAWAAGDDAGGLFSGSKAINTWYHVFLIRKDADGTIDAGFDTAIDATNRPVGYSDYRRIMSIRTDGSGNIRRFKQAGDRVWWTAEIVESTALPSVLTLLTVTIPPAVRSLAICSGLIGVDNAEGADLVIAHPDLTGEHIVLRAAMSSGAGKITAGTQFLAPSNLVSQIKYRWNQTGTLSDQSLSVVGWIEDRRNS
ncbi:MAG: hypothetical protein AB7Q81_24435 [Gammaproteobacteria bacterium]